MILYDSVCLAPGVNRQLLSRDGLHLSPAGLEVLRSNIESAVHDLNKACVDSAEPCHHVVDSQPTQRICGPLRYADVVITNASSKESKKSTFTTTITTTENTDTPTSSPLASLQRRTKKTVTARVQDKRSKSKQTRHNKVVKSAPWYPEVESRFSCLPIEDTDCDGLEERREIK